MSDASSQNSDGNNIDNDEEFDKPLVPSGKWEEPHTEDTLREIDEFNIKSRPLVKMHFIKQRKEFGRTYKFNDTDSNEKMNDIKQAADPFASQPSLVIDIQLQGCNPQKNTAAQTVWNRKINKAVVVDDQIQKLDIADDNPQLWNFIQNVQQEIEEALQSNETIDIFQNDFDLFTGEDQNFGADSELSTQIKEWKSFYYNNCKNKRITNIQFQPATSTTKSKYIAASFMPNLTFDDRIVSNYKSNKNMIVLWDYDDLHSIDPVMILVSPLEILCFAFNPKDPSQVVGGASNGQVFMWDLKNQEKLTGQVSSKKNNKQKQEQGDLIELSPVISSYLQEPSQMDGQQQMTDQIKTNIASHKNPILGLQWLPSTIQVERRNHFQVSQPSPTDIPHQFATISCDGQVLFWDNKFPSATDKNKTTTDPNHLQNYTWKAMFGLQLHKPQGGGPMGGAQIAFRQKQKTSTFTGTSDDGEVFFLNWAQKQSEEGEKLDMVQNYWNNHKNMRPTVGLDVSPDFDDIILTLHDFFFCIWKHGVDTPIFESNILKGAQITCGCFSPTRPGVIMIGRTDGQLDIWDFLDQSHKATMQYMVVSKMLTTMKFNEQYQNNLAIGDLDGQLHILEIPTTLYRKLGEEEKTMQEFWEREVQRVEYFKKRLEYREEVYNQEKQAKEQMLQEQQNQQSKTHRGGEDDKKETDEDILEREYQEFAEQYISEVILKEPPKEKPEDKDKKKK